MKGALQDAVNRLVKVRSFVVAIFLRLAYFLSFGDCRFHEHDF